MRSIRLFFTGRGMFTAKARECRPARPARAGILPGMTVLPDGGPAGRGPPRPAILAEPVLGDIAVITAYPSDDVSLPLEELKVKLRESLVAR
jgi:hypothetical protein